MRSVMGEQFLIIIYPFNQCTGERRIVGGTHSLIHSLLLLSLSIDSSGK